MEVTARHALKAPASVGGDQALVCEHKPPSHQNAPTCTTSDGPSSGSSTAPPTPPAEATQSATVPPQLSPQQIKAIAQLIAGRTFGQAAQAVDVDRSTLFRWRRDPVFAEEMRERLGETLDVVSRRMCSFMLESTDQLSAAMNSFDAKHRANIAFRILNSKRAWDIARMSAVDAE